jgi:hypothetical protein
VGFHSHELPKGYVGIAEDDLAALLEAEGLLQGLSSQDDRRELYAEIKEYCLAESCPGSGVSSALSMADAYATP